VTLDDQLGDLGCGDLLIDDDRIVAVGQTIDAPRAQRIDASDMIAMPGLVNAHMHTWQTALRGIAGDWTLGEYFRAMHAGLATRFHPEDIQIATLVGALNQINCGTTTLLDWCHNNPTPDHTDAAVDALCEAGIRAVFAHGSPKPDPKAGGQHFSQIPHPRGEIERLRRGRLAGDGALVTAAMAILGPHFSTWAVTEHDVRLGREHGLVISMHSGPAPLVPDGFERLAAAGLLGRDINIVHGNTLTDDQIRLAVDHGVSFSLTPEIELQMGHGEPLTGRLRRCGGEPSLGVDLESILGGDMFSIMRATLTHQRGAEHQAARAATGKPLDRIPITARDALRWATIEGARALRMDDRIGTLTPGKQADLLLIRKTDLNLLPVTDPVATIVLQVTPANVDSVFVAGKPLKRHGRMIYPQLAQRAAALAASRDRLLANPLI
jgi:cytosine/adenosine deaminase-related metal-dependent hydrolase